MDCDSEDLIHVEGVVIWHAKLAALEAGDSFRVAHSLNGFQGVDFLRLVCGDLMDVALVGRAG